MDDIVVKEQATESADRYIVPGLERGLRLLECFNPAHPVRTAPELGRYLGLPRSTVFRLLSTLENAGYLQRNGSEYRLGLAVLRLGYDFLSTQPLAQLAQPVAQSLCQRLGVTVNLGMRDGTSVVYVLRITPSGAFQGAVRTGSRLPVHACMLGRALLQDMTLSQLQTLFSGDTLPQFSESTPCTATQLRELLQRDRELGCAMGEGFYESGIFSMAVPVRNPQQHIVAALGIAIMFSDSASERIDHWQQALHTAAGELSRHLRTQHPAIPD